MRPGSCSRIQTQPRPHRSPPLWSGVLTAPKPAHSGPGPALLPALRHRRATGRLQRVAVDRPALLVPHLDVSSATRPAVICRTPRSASLLAGPPSPSLTRPIREPTHSDMPTTQPAVHRPEAQACRQRPPRLRQPPLQLRSVDTLPYWYSPLARVFDVSVNKVAELAEAWILDRWGLGQDDWWTDVRELRDQRSWERTSHRQGSVPPEENLQLYLEYHAMMTAAGELVDSQCPIRVDTWDSVDPWEYWLSPTCRRLEGGSPTCARRSRPSPCSLVACRSTAPGITRPNRRSSTARRPQERTTAGRPLLVAANTTVHRPGGCENTYYLVGDRPP